MPQIKTDRRGTTTRKAVRVTIVGMTESAPAGAPRARDAAPEDRRGRVVGAEKARLAESFGKALVRECDKLGWSIEKLVAVSGVSLRSVRMLVAGDTRPSVAMCLRLARGLRADYNDEIVAALAARLGDLAGPSLRDYSRRPHRRRARLLTKVRDEAQGGVPTSTADRLSDVTMSALWETWTRPASDGAR